MDGINELDIVKIDGNVVTSHQSAYFNYTVEISSNIVEINDYNAVEIDYIIEENI